MRPVVESVVAALLTAGLLLGARAACADAEAVRPPVARGGLFR